MNDLIPTKSYTPIFDAIRAGIMAPSLDQGQVDGVNWILIIMGGAPLSHCAYALATAFHETNRTMQPVREAYWLSEDWRKTHLRYYPYYGRGLVQLTWEANYRRADNELAAAGCIAAGDLMANLDMAMQIHNAAFIMRHGMEEGWFTQHTLGQHLPDATGTIEQFESARQIINGTDKAVVIAAYAMQFQDALTKGGW